mmetsp:Transcript_90310/g.234194  ORF Transcript_90310/g.234194 Transcript_90310/m.234194 type:complete len:262 (-) Transcript_90310:522-1307(-)
MPMRPWIGSGSPASGAAAERGQPQPQTLRPTPPRGRPRPRTRRQSPTPRAPLPLRNPTPRPPLPLPLLPLLALTRTTMMPMWVTIAPLMLSRSSASAACGVALGMQIHCRGASTLKSVDYSGLQQRPRKSQTHPEWNSEQSSFFASPLTAMHGRRQLTSPMPSLRPRCHWTMRPSPGRHCRRHCCRCCCQHHLTTKSLAQRPSMMKQRHYRPRPAMMRPQRCYDGWCWTPACLGLGHGSPSQALLTLAAPLGRPPQRHQRS